MPPPSKRRKLDKSKSNRVAEIQFDSAARADYLTGFHKRKLARIKHAQEAAAKKEREEKIRERRELRQRRKEELEEHLKAVNGALKRVNGEEAGSREDSEDPNDKSDGGSNEEWSGILDEPAPEVQSLDHEDEYIDEDKYTTVTVEAVDISKEGFTKADEDAEDAESEADEDGGQNGVKAHTTQSANQTSGQKSISRRKEKEGRPKKRRKQFRYESKGDRKIARAKQGRKNSMMAKARRDG
ncbi:hypothetical protein NA57DRAFT_76219 [Rhizodiscina lignyota]|uniref:Nucleolar protein 12 n=1 Tax=Rhizodiscina lignyota TaxID=1504668 RepID=A0A9P4IDS7_9PEZI|nr:hypothetical protein NA57DRAFT_76219 [Rhizodiscina lignyota]